MAPKKKILHLINTAERGGAEMSLLRMLPLLNETFESIFVTLRGRGPLAENFERAGIKVIEVNQKHPWDIASYVRLRKILKTTHPDLIVTHLLLPDLIGRFFIQIFTPYKVISSLATTYNFPRYRIARFIEKSTRYFCRGYMANAESVKKTYVEKFGVPEKKVTVVPTGMDIESLQATVPNETLRHSLGIKATDTVIICVANLHINKGHRYLLEAFEQLYKKHPDTKLLLVGGGQEKDALRNQVELYASKEAILFLGQRSDVSELLALSHIFALPTFFEGMCNAIMEAMASKLPVVTTDIPENQELVTHEKTGLLCPVKDTQRLANALERLVSDKQLAKTLGQNGAESIERRYNLKDSVSRWREYFLTLSN
ncbi:MAG: glycosyltransferase [Patescibacteria group bacterium]